MGLPKGTNNGNHGAKGRSGRKGAGVERNNAQILREMFFTDQGRNETLEKLKTGKYSLRDVFVSKAYAGNERMLLALFNKNFPDAALRDAGGEGREAENADRTPDKVKTVGDVLRLIEETINRVKAESMTLDQANSLGRLAGTAIKAIEVGELKEKIDLLESVIRERKERMK